MAEENKAVETKEAPVAEEKAAAPADQGPFVHTLRFYLIGGQTFTLNEVTNSSEPSTNVIAFINAWRENRDVWHSPNGDPRFGVRVRDVALYEYGIARAEAKPAEAKAEEEKPAE
ncbi:MAG: hypothetical protein SOR95_03730 [Sutterella sp.]|mgnify:FL=1|nr:hypothetical protein [Sutterella sp.]